MRDYLLCFTFNIHIPCMYDNSIRGTICHEVALNSSNLDKDARKKGRPVVEGECQRT